MVVQCCAAEACQPLVLAEPMAAILGREHSGSRVVQRLLEVCMAMLHAVLVLAVVPQNQQVVEEHTCQLPVMGRTGLECLLVEDQMEDPLVAGVVLTLLQGRMDLAADLPLAVAGLGMERLQHSLEYCGVTLALVGQSLACRSMLEYGLC